MGGLQRYLEYARRERASHEGWTSQTLLHWLAALGICASAAYWGAIHWMLMGGNVVLAVAFTAIIVFGTPGLASFFLPWSPAGMLLAKTRSKTYGQIAAATMFFVLLGYSVHVSYSFWLAQPAIVASQMEVWMVVIGVVGFIGMPALVWTPVSMKEFVSHIDQAHQVTRYEMMIKADLASLRAQLIQYQMLCMKNWAELLPEERKQIALFGKALYQGIQKTLIDLGGGFELVSKSAIKFQLKDSDVLGEWMGSIEDALDVPREPLLSEEQYSTARGQALMKIGKKMEQQGPVTVSKRQQRAQEARDQQTITRLLNVQEVDGANDTR
jgi:hypothetical protein